MPYVLTLKAPLERSKPVWEGEGCDDSSHSHSPQRRCHSVSTPRELKNSSSSIQVRAASLGDEQQQELSTTQSGLAPSASSSSPVLRRRRGYGSRGCTVASEGGKPDASVGNGGLGMGAGAGDRRSAVEQSRSAAGNNNNNHHQAAAAAAAAAGGGGGGRREGVRRVESYESSGNLSSGQQQPQQPQQQQQRVAQRLLVVANRLPVSAIRDGDGWDLKLSAGGLVSALLGVKQNFETRWIGWAGVNVPDEEGRASLTEALALKGCVPVFLDEDTVDQYYNGYCNNVLWPLFHYIGLPQEDRLAATRSMDSQFNAYKHANQLFAQVVFSQYQEGDVVWCHDYHLMCLPKFLKDLDSHMKVGWFLHTPFPSSEIYRTLPLRSELLKAVLTADLIGFHTYDYARHFVSACTRILGLEGTPEGVEDHGKLTRVSAFPIGIDPERFIQALETDQVKLHIKELRRFFAGRKVMLGVDRLDMIKGIPQKLLAFEMFLEKHPEWQENVLLVQIAVPTRTDVPEYQRLTSQVHEIVGRINGRFGSVTFVPIHHLDRSLAFHELCALYASTDVVLVTSLRDGMNLVSYEYVACQNSKKTEGVLVLSEFSGAAQSLGAGALLVNPWNIREMCGAIEVALNMPENERKERQRHNFTHVTTHTAQAWADTFVSELNDTVVEAELRTLHTVLHLPLETAVGRFQESKNRLLILGFNATITAQVEGPRRRGPDQIMEMNLQLHPGMRDSLATLCADPNTILVILSGSERTVLDEAFGDYSMWLAAENGMFLRHTHGEWMTTMPEPLNMDWVESVQLVFDYFCERTPRSFVETRETSLVWNYKYADGEFGRVQARNMLQHLWTGPISNAAVDVVQGSKSVEVRPVGVSKGAAIDRIIAEIIRSKDMRLQIDYVMCMGHFLSKDEDVYTYFDPKLPFERDRHSSTHLTTNGKLDKAAGDRRLAAKSCDRYLAKSNKMAVVRTKSGSLLSPESNGSPYTRSNNFKDRKNIDWETMELDSSVVMNISADTYFSCAVGRKSSAARYSLSSTEEVVDFFQALANTYSKPVSEANSGPPLHSSSASMGLHVLQAAGDQLCPLQCGT
ncbi:hypothetical protein BDL97_08G007600 [Sphagnum fallax]|nr:hypothetical protein BDL97_08G007600 [Sphagnum fallax]